MNGNQIQPFNLYSDIEVASLLNDYGEIKFSESIKNFVTTIAVKYI